MGFVKTLACLCYFMVPVLGILLPIPLCDIRRNLTPEQVELCKQFKEKHLDLLLDAKFKSEFECKKQFAGRRWNCTMPPSSNVTPLLLPRLPLATKETSYLYASMSAAMMHTISRGCMAGTLKNYCACSEEGRPRDLPKNQIWGGCGDNLPYGYKFSKMFTDAGEQLTETSLTGFSRVLMNLHNNEAGRWAVYEKSFIKCRCHGVSTNCPTKTCYRQLGRFHTVAKHLETLHQDAVHVKLQKDVPDAEEEGNVEMKLVETSPGFTKKSTKDLVYISDSPSYCERSIRTGSYGVAGRPCTKEGNIHTDCEAMCCQKGHYSKREIVRTKCGCKLIWCCEVKCNICENEQNNHYCK
uniref:Protein Wnt n=1 Tax=Clytia hemisphaerica TaxID=252671 RepID=B3FRM9_9CNID|nr:Wnt5 [Clytia hemisphaerica]